MIPALAAYMGFNTLSIMRYLLCPNIIGEPPIFICNAATLGVFSKRETIERCSQYLTFGCLTFFFIFR